MNVDQMRAGRTLLRWSQADLSEKSGVSLSTIRRLEAMDGHLLANRTTLDALQRALTDGGLILLDVDDVTPGGHGVRLRKEDSSNG